MKNTLQNWYSEKQRLNTMGVNDYDYHNLSDLKKMLECEEVARKRMYIPSYKVHQISFFSTWFNNNCATVICGEHGSHELRLVIHEPQQGGMSEDLENRQIENYLNYGEAYNKALYIESGLKDGENPILKVHTGQINAFSDAFWEGLDLRDLPLVKKTYLTSTSNPDTQLKPFDIVRRLGSSGSSSGSGPHSAIYLGNGMIAHVPGSNKGVRIENWSDFLGSGSYASVERYHPLIPYKHQDGTNGIKNHIARAVASDEYDTSYELTGIFQGFNRTHGNCQHFANRCVFGLNFSESGTWFKKKVPLAEEIGDTDREFRNLTIRDVNQGHYQLKKNQIDSWRNNYQGQQFETKIEVRPSPPCKIQ